MACQSTPEPVIVEVPIEVKTAVLPPYSLIMKACPLVFNDARIETVTETLADWGTCQYNHREEIKAWYLSQE